MLGLRSRASVFSAGLHQLQLHAGRGQAHVSARDLLPNTGTWPRDPVSVEPRPVNIRMRSPQDSTASSCSSSHTGCERPGARIIHQPQPLEETIAKFAPVPQKWQHHFESARHIQINGRAGRRPDCEWWRRSRQLPAGHHRCNTSRRCTAPARSRDCPRRCGSTAANRTAPADRPPRTAAWCGRFPDCCTACAAC